MFQVLALSILNGGRDIAQQVSNESWRRIYASVFDILTHLDEGESVGSGQLTVFVKNGLQGLIHHICHPKVVYP
jgi:hypothetical protein